MAHARHQLSGAGPRRGGDHVARVPQVVKVQLGRNARSLPSGDSVVPQGAPPELPALRPDEYVSIPAGGAELLQAPRDLVEQLGREGDGRYPGCRLRRLVEGPARPPLHLRAAHGDSQRPQVDVPALLA